MRLRCIYHSTGGSSQSPCGSDPSDSERLPEDLFRDTCITWPDMKGDRMEKSSIVYAMKTGIVTIGAVVGLGLVDYLADHGARLIDVLLGIL